MNSKAFLIFTVSLFALCLGEPECGKNQCKDLWTAKTCNKVKYCIEEEWSKLKPTGNRDNVCEICLRMVKEARDTLRSNETREELLEVFEGSCRLLLLKPAVELCDNLVDQFVPELVDILSSQMDPETVCSVAKLCNNEMFAEMVKNSKACIYCESFTEILSNQMNALSSEQFKNGIINRCKNAGSFSDACYYISSIYSDSFYNNSKLIINNKPCEVTSLCPSGSLHPQSIVKIKKKMCPLCRNVMTSLKKQLLSVKSSEEFVENMFKICEKFNFPYNTCLKVSNPTLYTKLKNYDALNLFCRISFCGEKPDEISSFLPLVPSDDESFSLTRQLDPLELLENYELFFPEIKKENTKEIRTTTEAVRPTIAYGDPVEDPVFFGPIIPSLVEGRDCKTCSHVLGMLESGHYKKGNSVDMINICNNAENVDLCKDFVNNFSHILSMATAQGFATKKICEDLVPSCVIKKNDISSQQKSGSYCNICLNTVKVLKQVDPMYWPEIKGKCKILPENTRGLCTYVFSNLPSYLISSNETEICDSLNFCGPSAIEVENVTDVQPLIKLDESRICEICVSTLEELVEMAKNNHSGLVIRVILDSVCYLLPPEERKMCTNLIEILGVEKILDVIRSMYPPEVCSEIHLCTSNGVVVPESVLKETSVEGDRKIPCKFCLMAIKTLLDQLQNDKTEDAIRKALDSLCDYLPEETRDTCRTLVNEYTEDLIDMIIADFNASEICMYLKICSHPALSVVSIAVDSDAGSNKNDYVVFDIQTNQVLDWNEKPTSETRTLEKPTPKDLEKLHEYVKECALCEALVGVINSHSKMKSKEYDFTEHSGYICSIVPRRDMEKCKSLLISYGPSIRNLLDKNIDINEICVYVDLCDPKMQAKVNQPVSVSESKFIIPEENECAKGPRFWCANAENAEKCGTFLHCQETVWKTWENPPKRPTAH